MRYRFYAVSMVMEGRNQTRVDAFTEVLGSHPRVLVTTSKVADLGDLAFAMREGDPAEEVCVLTDEETVSELRRRFLTAAHVADFVERDRFRIRTVDDRLPTFLLTESELTTVTGIDESLLATFSRSDSDFVDETYAAVEARFEDGEAVSLRVPGFSQMIADLDEELGESMRADLSSMLEVALATRDTESDVDPVRLSILAGAKNEVQMYELSRWGEESGVASRSKYSREKTQLEDVGLVGTEKINSGVGRPRQRLVLADDVADADVEELVSLTESVLT